MFLSQPILALPIISYFAVAMVPTSTYSLAQRGPSPTTVSTLAPTSYPPSLCGWVGGDLLQPASCKTNEKCVYDPGKANVGCCPLAGSCSDAFFTACVDSKSVQTTVRSPGVLVCPSSKACYRNTYAGAYYQYGCGSTNQGTWIATTYTGQASGPQLQILYTSIEFMTTASSGSLSSSTTATTSSSRSASPTAQNSQASTSGVPGPSKVINTQMSPVLPVQQQPTSSRSPAAASSATPTPVNAPSRTSGVIIAAGVISSVLGVLFIAIIAFCFFRRRHLRSERQFLEKSDSHSSNGSLYSKSYEYSSFPTAEPPRPGIAFQPTPRIGNRYYGPDHIVPSLTPNPSEVPSSTEVPNNMQKGIFLFDQIDGLPDPWAKPPALPPRSPRRLTPKNDIRNEVVEENDIARTPVEYYTGRPPVNEDDISAISDSSSSAYSRDTNGNGIISGLDGYPELEISPLEYAPPALNIKSHRRSGTSQEPVAGRPYAPTPQTSDETAVPNTTESAGPEQWRTRRLTIEKTTDAPGVQQVQPPTLVTAKNRMVPLLGVPEPKPASDKPSRLYDISNPFNSQSSRST